MARIRAAIGPCASLQWLFIESDSSDGTADRLAALAAEDDSVAFQSLGRLGQTMPARTQRIATCRNAYLDRVFDDTRYADVDYVVAADFDGLNSELTRAAFRSCWTTDIAWDMCAANQSGPYYDVWALRHAAWSPNDCWAQFAFLRQHGLRNDRALDAAVHARMLRISPHAAWIEVDSAFGGLAVYRKEALSGCRYEGLIAEGKEVCEHVHLHRMMRDRGQRLYINPALINTTHTDASRNMGRFRALGRRIKAIALRALGCR